MKEELERKLTPIEKQITIGLRACKGFYPCKEEKIPANGYFIKIPLAGVVSTFFVKENKEMFLKWMRNAGETLWDEIVEKEKAVTNE